MKKFFIILFTLLTIFGCSKIKKAEKHFNKAVNETDIQKQIILLEESLKKFPFYIKAYWKLAYIFEKLTPPLFDKSIIIYNKITELFPDYKLTFYNLGCIYALLNSHNKAIENFELSKSLNLNEINFNLAYSYYLKGEYKSSLNYLDIIIKNDVSNLNALFLKGLVNYQLMNYNESIKNFNDYLFQKPDSIEAIINKASVFFALNNYNASLNEINKIPEDYNYLEKYYLKSLLNLYVSNNLNESLINIDKALEIKPLSIILNKQKLDILVAKGNKTKIIEQLTYMLTFDNNNSSYYYFLRGYYKYLSLDMIEAQNDYNLLLKINNNKIFIDKTFKDIYSMPLSDINFFIKNTFKQTDINLPLLTNILLFYTSFDLPENLDVSFNKYIVENRKKNNSENNLNKLYESNDIMDELFESSNDSNNKTNNKSYIKIIISILLIITAIFLYFKIPKKSSISSIELLSNVSLCDNNEEKIAQLNYITKIDPFFKDAYIQKIQIYKSLKDWDNLIKEISILLKLDPENGEIFRLRGIAYKEIGKIDEAKEDFKKASELKDSIYYISKGNQKIKNNEFNEAIEEFNIAILKNPLQAIAFANRGIAKAHNNELEEALEDYNKAIELDPKYINAYKNRAITYERLKLFDLKDKDMQIILELEKEQENNEENK